MLTIANENFLSEAEAAGILGQKVATLRWNRARRKGPPVVRHGRTLLYREAALLDWLKRQEVDLEAVRRVAASA
jgi:hypothetical protein